MHGIISAVSSGCMGEIVNSRRLADPDIGTTGIRCHDVDTRRTRYTLSGIESSAGSGFVRNQVVDKAGRVRQSVYRVVYIFRLPYGHRSFSALGSHLRPLSEPLVTRPFALSVKRNNFLRYFSLGCAISQVGRLGKRQTVNRCGDASGRFLGTRQKVPTDGTNHSTASERHR